MQITTNRQAKLSRFIKYAPSQYVLLLIDLRHRKHFKFLQTHLHLATIV